MSGIAATLSFTGISIILALSCFVVLKAGEISFGQQAFFGLGAYSAGLLTTLYGWPLSAALVAASVFGAMIAFAFSVPLMRMSGFRFTLTTLIMAEFLRELLLRFTLVRTINGRDVGPDGPLGFSGIEYFYQHRIGVWTQAILMIVAAFVCVSLTAIYLRSRAGRKLVAVASDAKLAASLTVDPFAVRRGAFVYSGGLAAFGGALFAHHATYIDAANFGIMMGVHAIAYVLIGGVSTVLGPVVGTTIDVVLLEWLRLFGPFRMVVFGLIIVAILVLRPGGVLHKGRGEV